MRYCDKKTKRQKDRTTKRQKDKKTKRQKDKETKRKKKTKRQKGNKTMLYWSLVKYIMVAYFMRHYTRTTISHGCRFCEILLQNHNIS